MNDTDPDNTIDGVMPAEEMAQLLSARESKGAWDAGAANVYAGHDTCPEHSAPESPRYRYGLGCTCKIVAQVDDDCDRALVAAAPHLAESGLALHAEVARLRALLTDVESGEAHTCEEHGDGTTLATQLDDAGNPVCDEHSDGIVCRRDLPHADVIRTLPRGR